MCIRRGRGAVPDEPGSCVNSYRNPRVVVVVVTQTSLSISQMQSAHSPRATYRYLLNYPANTAHNMHHTTAYSYIQLQQVLRVQNIPHTSFDQSAQHTARATALILSTEQPHRSEVLCVRNRLGVCAHNTVLRGHLVRRLCHDRSSGIRVGSQHHRGGVGRNHGSGHCPTSNSGRVLHQVRTGHVGFQRRRSFPAA
jgi:hypothetical protein